MRQHWIIGVEVSGASRLLAEGAEASLSVRRALRETGIPGIADAYYIRTGQVAERVRCTSVAPAAVPPPAEPPKPAGIGRPAPIVAPKRGDEG